MTFLKVLDKYRKYSFSERDKGDRFERLMQAYLLTDPIYAPKFKHVWMWNEFPGKKDFGGRDVGIDLVAYTIEGDYWAIQCKCLQESAIIDKPAVDGFLATSSKTFKHDGTHTTKFSNCLWISTTNNWGPNATQAIQNQSPPVNRINLYDLEESAVDWEKLDNGISGEAARKTKYGLKAHQKEALEKVHEHFKTADRGKMIMACGTGKTFTALKIAEHETQGKGLILFMVPSIALLGQTLREWTAQADEDINAICICSDAEITKDKKKDGDADYFSVVDLALPASTNVKNIIKQFQYLKAVDKKGMIVVFSTYQSIEVVSRAQAELSKQYPEYEKFDLIICDEAHRTTGVSLDGEDTSAFIKVHYEDSVSADKRLYMTATPRLYSDEAKGKAAQADAILCSMDDEKLYGEEIYRIGFGEAVEKNLLTDYKVLILTVSEKDVPLAVQRMVANKENEINSDDASKLIGCINALSKQILGDAGLIKDSDPEPMRRAVAFCQNIKISKKITTIFNDTTEIYLDTLREDKKNEMVSVTSKHIDGTMTAPIRDGLLGWLKEKSAPNECRVLTNVRCLSEGVDVPSLDAVLFLSARNSQVDVVQSVGRVMRLAPGKKYGYIIIPVVIPNDVDPNQALDDNERFKVVWTVLNALRAHDDRFNATVNKIELNKNKPGQIIIGGVGGGDRIENQSEEVNKEINKQLAIQFEQLQSVVFAKMVQKVGDRRYWEQWAKNVADIASRQVERINRLITEDETHQKEFSNFLSGLQKNINPSISEHQAVDMLSQHIITKPVFEALFDGYSFVKNNPISISMQTMLNLLQDQSFEKDADVLHKFYESVRMRASGIDNAEGKQRIIVELYDKFFKTAFPKMVEQLGIVYTPVECVDFIIHSVNDILKKEFGRSVSDENVHILDPFTGTGTFITRLLQSGLIEQNDLERKYKYEIHANEIVLLAYYIAAINIENAYHDATIDPNDGIGKEKYTPFDGIVLTDTFQLGESDDSTKLFAEMFPQNSERVARQKKAPLRVIIGNPPYSVGQKSANDNAQNQKYEKLDLRIELTYAKESSATSVKALYDSYIKAFRWSTDRLDKNGGVVCYISNAGWIDGNSTNGFRKCLEKEFSSIYIFDLRGNGRTSGERCRQEGEPLFAAHGGKGGSLTPIAITFLVKKPKSKQSNAKIYYHDIGMYLKRNQKLEILKGYKTIFNSEIFWQSLQPNEHGDWLNQRNDIFESFIQLGAEKKFDTKSHSFFITYSLGTASARDSWVYNSSKNILAKSMVKTIEFYNEQRKMFVITKKSSPKLEFNKYASTDSTKISWNDSLRSLCEKNIELKMNQSLIRIGLYRPFYKTNLYFDKNFIQRPYQQPKLFPSSQVDNLIIAVSAPGGNKELSVIISNCIPDLHLTGDTQCFPLFYFEEHQKQSPTLFDSAGDSEYIRRDGVSDFILDRARVIYGKTVGKEDIFYYVYGYLHSPEYKIKFANDLKKMLPRLPLVEEPRDFWKFSKAGRALAELHINYETVPAYPDVIVKGDDSGFFKVEKMRFPAKDRKDTILYNSKITIENIPEKAYQYVVNGKSAVEWIMERYRVTIDLNSKGEGSGIKNDPNDWAEEVGNERYILDLLLSIINVSVQTVDIVNGLPEVKFE